MVKLPWFYQSHETKCEPEVTGCNFVDFSRRFSTFKLCPGAQLEKSQIIPALWIFISFSFFLPLCSFLSLFTLYSFLIFPVPSPSSLFTLSCGFYSGKSQSIFQPAFVQFHSPMSVYLLAEDEQMGLFPLLWNAATSEVEHCSHSIFSMCRGSPERKWRITFLPESTFLGRLNISWN